MLMHNKEYAVALTNWLPTEWVRETENNLNITIDIPEEPAICNIRPSTLKMRTGDSSGVSMYIYQI